MKKLFAFLPLALALAAVAARADEPRIDFDAGVDAKAVLQSLREPRAGTPLAHAGPVSAFRTERDCVTISFNAQDPLTSERIRLVSREYREVCHPAPQGGQYCHEELAWTHSATLRVQITDRGAMLPWEHDVFWACLDGTWLQADVIDASHKYDLKFTGTYYDATLTAKAGAKIKALPDANGITAEAPAYDAASDNLVLSLQDRWADFYTGDKTVLTVQLKRVRDLWVDPVVVEKEITLDPARGYTVKFADYAADFSEKLSKGKKYYVNWRFKRAGNVSKDNWMKYRETGQTVFGQAPALNALACKPGTDAVASSVKVCWIKTIEKNECVYKCSDKTEHRQPAATQDPAHPDQPVLACPQLVFPF